MVYFAEKKDPGEIASCNETLVWGEETLNCRGFTFAESFWWGLMTLTTVGHEINPTTFMGRTIGR